MLPPSPTQNTFQKIALTASQHVIRLQSKGLTVNDVSEAEKTISRIGYYRLLPHMRFFQDVNSNFVSGVNFDQVIELYNFDRKLRLLCFDAIERIEVCMRSFIIEELCVPHGPHFYTNSTHFISQDHYDNTQDLARSIRHDSITHYMKTYSNPVLPCFWALCEGMTFGQLSKFYSGLNTSHKRAIAKRFGYPKDVIVSWFRAMTDFRNCCTHHNTIWNIRRNRDAPMRPKGTRAAAEFPNPMLLHARIIAVVELLRVADPHSDWKYRFIELVDEFSNLISEADMGLTNGWRQRPYWQ